MNKFEIDKAFISEHDAFLHHFDKTHPQKSVSQQKEIAKHERIARLRDGEAVTPPPLIKRLLRVFCK